MFHIFSFIRHESIMFDRFVGICVCMCSFWWLNNKLSPFSAVAAAPWLRYTYIWIEEAFWGAHKMGEFVWTDSELN